MDHFEFPVEIIRTSRRKSASIQIDGDRVKVRVPEWVSDGYVQDLVLKKSLWIKRKLGEAEHIALFRPKEFVSGENFSYLGKNYRLKVQEGDTSSVKIQGGYIETNICGSILSKEEQVKSLLIEWYNKQARQRLTEKTHRYAKIIQVEPRSISVKDYKSRWGSCSIKGDISYNWRIVIAPHRIVDYVVVHELCHILEHNHSPNYWRHVGRVMSDFKECRRWLQQNSKHLQI